MSDTVETIEAKQKAAMYVMGQVSSTAAKNTIEGEGVVYDMMRKYDKNGDGSFDASEVAQIVQDIVEQKGKVKLLGRFVLVLVLLLFAALGAIFGVSLLASEASKESHVEGAAMTTLTGEALQTAPVESFVDTIFDLPSVSTNNLAYLKHVSFYADMTANAAVGGWVEATFKIEGAYQPSANAVFITTTGGKTVAIDGDAQTGTITMDGAVYPISDALPVGARRLVPADSKKGVIPAARRELSSYSGSLMTSGSFTMMASSSFL